LSDPWFSRVHREFEAGTITRTSRDVLLALGRFHACRFGIFPSHALLAARARCSVRTVQRALQAARDLGLVSWCARRVRAAWRSLRTSNRYVLTVPPRPVRTDGQDGRREVLRKQEQAHEVADPGVLAVLDAIWRRRQAALRLNNTA
jgi:hypothetical protein